MKTVAKDFLYICFGTLAMALGYSYFLIPNNIAAGGATGVATILHVKFNIPVSLVVLVINGVLFSVSWKTMPKSVFVKSAIGTVFLTLFLEWFAVDQPFTDDKILAAVFGGALIGIGIGLVVRCGASTGGSDFLAIILNNLLKGQVTVAKLILIIDGVVILAAGLVLGDYTLMLYMVLSVYVVSKVADTIVEGGHAAKSAYIISNHGEKISAEIMKNLHRGTTGIYGKGMYTGRDITIILCVVKRNEIPRLRSIVKETDEKAFIILTEVREVLGEGF